MEDEYAELVDYLGSRRSQILQAWRDAVKQDPALTSGDSIPGSELNDHIPAMLSSFERRLLSQCSDARACSRSDYLPQDAAAHGLHRWQQGYDLREVTGELGRLNECMVVQLNGYERERPSVPAEVMAAARCLWAATCTEGISASAAQYFCLQQMEAAGQVVELENALQAVRNLESQRAELWQQAAHDLRGNLGVVVNATAGLAAGRAPVSSQESLLRLLQKNVVSLKNLLDDVTSLARLQAGREVREACEVDIAAALQELSDGLSHLALEKGLVLRCSGPSTLIVQADKVKIRRLAQNLLLNAIKYTTVGHVTMTWGGSGGGDEKRWALTIQDTGPGLKEGPVAGMAGALEVATNLGHEARARDTLVPPPPHPEPTPPLSPLSTHVPGEGIGLSIVKRLCELLDATIEISSAEGHGTTFRILLPRKYA